MSFEEAANQLAMRLRATRRGYLSLTKEELRTAFGVGRFTQGQSDAVIEALQACEIYVHPSPADAGGTLRIYDLKQELGQIAFAVAAPDETTEGPLRDVAGVFARQRSGRDLRSEDASWIETFGLMLELVVGREPAAWEDLRDDRHPTGLAKELASALGITARVDESWFYNLAVVAASFRPPRRPFRPEGFAPNPEALEWAVELASLVEIRTRRAEEERRKVLHAAARLALLGKAPPDEQIELGILGLRRRRENEA